MREREAEKKNALGVRLDMSRDKKGQKDKKRKKRKVCAERGQKHREPGFWSLV